MRARWWFIGILLPVFIVLAVLMAPLSAGYKAECDKRGGFYDYKSTACWSGGGYEVLAWKK